MCGITGIWQRDGSPVTPATIERFTRSLAHRGPDGEGTFIDEALPLALGHRRLSILDPTPAGRQPMRSLDGRYWVTFNGEIYNFVELRVELESAGYRFATQTDTEVIAAAYDRWGDACQNRFNGMWAFALWDRYARRLLLSRDRFGVKPVYYLAHARRFAFASELKAFFSLDDFVPAENSAALARALDDPFAAESSEETLLRGIVRLLPGHQLALTQAGLSITRWWNTLDHRVRPARRFTDQAAELRELLFDATRIRLRSDVPVATALSGGLDSSSILSMLASLDAAPRGIDSIERHAGEWRRAFTATFAGTPLDERRYAEIVARHAGIPLDEVAVLATPTVAEIERVVWDLDDVTFTDATPIWSLYRALRRNGITVALNGDGADELFGGYLHHTDFALARGGGFFRSPRRFLDLVETRYHLPGENGPIARTSRLRLALYQDSVLRRISRPARALFTLFRGRAAPIRVIPRETWLRPESLDRDAFDRAGNAAEREARAAGLSPLGAHLYAEFHATKLPKILRMFDRASMAHGVEIRNAFLDWRVVRYAFSLPDESKIGGGFSKRILREAMRGIVPEVVRTRRNKIGFNAPLPLWFAGPLREWLWEIVNENSFLHGEEWDGRAIRDFVATKRAGDAWSWGEGEAVWPFLHAHLWRRYVLGAPGPR